MKNGQRDQEQKVMRKVKKKKAMTKRTQMSMPGEISDAKVSMRRIETMRQMIKVMIGDTDEYVA
jgi:hypothetical protein